MAETYTIKAVLEAYDKGFSSGLSKAQSSVEKLSSRISSGIGFGVLTGIGQKAFDTLSNGAQSLYAEMAESSTAWQTFGSNLKRIGKMSGQTSTEITRNTKKVRNELQDYATKTIYSASDMASTYSQLAAVGIKSADKLVTGFGGIAASAENPKQAMRTLSQQATQMAAKPKVAWEDFKLMLEQSPGGIAAVAQTMGKSTKQLVSDVQAGKVSTDDFFKAIEKVGNSKSMTKQAQQYKTVGEAMDGLKEEMSVKLMPAFDKVSQAGIKCIQKIIDSVQNLPSKQIEEFGTKVGNGITSAFDFITKHWGVISTLGKVLLGAAVGFKAIQTSLAVTNEIKEFAANIKEVGNAVKDAAGKVSTFIEKAKGLGDAAESAKGIGDVADETKALGDATESAKNIGDVADKTKSLGDAANDAEGLGDVADKTKSLGDAAKDAEGLGDVADKTKSLGDAAGSSSANMVAAGKTFMEFGAGIVLIAAGFWILADAAKNVAEAGPAAIGVLFGLIGAVAALGIGMLAFANTMTAAIPTLSAIGPAFMMMGAALAIAGAGLWIIAQAAVSVASAGGPAIAVLFGMIGAIAGLAIVFGIIGPLLTVGAVGMLAFGAAIVLVGAGALLASMGLQMVAQSLPLVVQYGAKASVAILMLSGSLIAFSASSIASGASLLVLAAGLLAASLGAIAFFAGMVVASTGAGLLALALKLVSAQLKTIQSSSQAAATNLKTMVTSVSIVKSGMDALQSKVSSVMSAMKSAFSSTSDGLKTAAQAIVTSTLQVSAAFNVMRAAVAAVLSAILGTVKSKFNAINAFFLSLVPTYNTYGVAIMTGLKNGINSQMGAVSNVASAVVNKLKQTFTEGLGIHSPSRWFFGIGSYSMEGLENGMSSKNIEKFSKGIVGDMKGAFKGSRFSAEANVDYMGDDAMKEVAWMRKYDGGSVVGGAGDGKLGRFVSNMLGLVNDNSHGYSQSNRWGPDYDCSSSIITSLKKAGFNVGAANTTFNMSRELTSRGWNRLPYRNPKKGDILLNDDKHVEMALGNGLNAGFHSAHGHPETGDQAHEAYVGRDPGGWAAILRYKNGYSESLADAIEEAYNFKKYGFGAIDAEGDSDANISAKYAGGGSLASWLTEALKLTGQPMSLLPGLMYAAKSESGGNPNAVNRWDSNAKAGHPSKGLLQTIDSTFNAYKLPGHNNIFNPVDNAAAAIRYMIARYGSVAKVVNPRLGHWRGYKTGTKRAKKGLAWVGEAGPELMSFGGGERVYTHNQSRRIARDAGVNFGAGIERGIMDSIGGLSRDMQNTMTYSVGNGRGSRMTLSGTDGDLPEIHITTEVNSIMDGRKVGYGTAKFVQEKNDYESKRLSRVRGELQNV